MAASFTARASRQTVLLSAVATLHVGAFLLVAGGLIPRFPLPDPPPLPIQAFEPPPAPPTPVRPDKTEVADVDVVPEPMPTWVATVIEETAVSPAWTRDATASGEGAGPTLPVEVYQSPALRTRDSRLAAMIDACYPSAARRFSEEGRVVALVTIDSGGRATAWSIAQSSGFTRLDTAMDCVIRRLEFVPGRRDGRSVEATVLLPIVFRLD